MPDKLLFIDTNIWLDFYRGRGDTSIGLLKKIEGLSDRLIVTLQVEKEFKKNRQAAIIEGMKGLAKPLEVPARLGIFSEHEATKGIVKAREDAARHGKTLKELLGNALQEPKVHDAVYAACERLFSKEDSLALKWRTSGREVLYKFAERRFREDLPPRKPGDKFYGDAINWEWILRCVNTHKADLVVVTRDGDYGVDVDGDAYINDFLEKDFIAAGGKSVLLFSRLTKALKEFDVRVTAQEVEEEEAAIVESEKTGGLGGLGLFQLSDEGKRMYTEFLQSSMRRGNILNLLYKDGPGLRNPYEPDDPSKKE